MLTILVLSDEGEGYELAYQLTQENQNVKYWQRGGDEDLPRAKTELKTNQVDKYQEHLAGADLVVSCGPATGRIASELGARGMLVLGSRLSSELVNVEEVARGAVKLLGGEIGSRQSNSVRVSGYIHRGGVISSWCSFHSNRMLDGDRGPLVESMGCSVWRTPETTELDKLAPLLTAYDHSGFVSIEYNMDDAIVEISLDAHGDWLYGFLAGCREMKHQALFNLARGNKVQMTRFATAVKLGYLSSDVTPKLESSAQRHYWAGRNPGYWGTVTASGDTIRESRRRAYRTIRNIAPVDLIYRNGIGLSLEERREESGHEM